MKRFLICLFATFLSLSTIVLTVGCVDNNNDGNGSNVGSSNMTDINNSLSLSKNSIELEEGAQYTLVANISPETANVQWSSSNESVAIVNSTGRVTAISEGTATIKAIIANSTAADFCVVQVKKKNQSVQPPIQQESIVLSKTEVSIDVDGSYLLSALVTPSNNKITWSSTDESIVTVNNGLVTGMSAGIAFIRATTEGGITAVCTVEVKEVYGSISGTITCRNRKTGIDEVDVSTKIYLISYEAESVNLNSIMMGFEYNMPEKGIYQVSVNALGSYEINSIKLGKYRMIIVCKGSNFTFSAASASTGNQRKAVLGEIYNKGTTEHKNWVETQVVYDAQMSGFDVNVGKTHLTITRRVYDVYADSNVG